jgi:hypothetical protein
MSNFTLNEREHIVRTLVQRVIDGNLVSLMILDASGMGKTYMVTSYDKRI